MSKLESKLIIVALAWGIYFILSLVCLVAVLEDQSDNYNTKFGAIILWTIINIGIVLSIWKK